MQFTHTQTVSKYDAATSGTKISIKVGRDEAVDRNKHIFTPLNVYRIVYLSSLKKCFVLFCFLNEINTMAV